VITAHGPFEGLDRFEARPAVVAALREEGRIVAEKRPYVHAVGHCSRCGTVVEPRLSLQWFVKVAPAGQGAGDAVRDGRVKIHPPSWSRATSTGSTTCTTGASRASCGGATASRSGTARRRDRLRRPGRAAACPEGWRQDPDVLDTWFSSALWPFSTLGWPDDTADLREFYPTRAGHRLRHPVLLGRPDDDVRPVRDGRTAQPFPSHGLAARPGARPVRQEDVEVAGQRHRPAGLDRRVRRRRAPVHPGPRRQPGRDLADRRGVGARLAQLLQQALERHPLRADERRDGPGVPERPRSCPRDRWILSRLTAVIGRGRRADRGLRVREGLRGALPLRLGRGLRLVPGAGQGAARGRRAGGGEHPRGARPRAGRDAAPAAPVSSRSSPRSCGRR
jgi:hypothetical protein